jgi:hypothetical protein
MVRGCLVGIALVLLLGAPVAAQQSASYTIEQGTFNNGGNPSPTLTSAGYQMTLDSIGDGIAGPAASSASYGLEPGFTSTYAPPGEVRNLRFTTSTSFTWDAERSVGTYNTYRGVLGSYTTYGLCLHSGLTATIDSDSQEPTGGATWYYVVSAENRLREEGVTGYNSQGTPHPNTSSCP